MKKLLSSCNNTCVNFVYSPAGGISRLERFICIHPINIGKYKGHKIINKKYVACGGFPKICPLEDYKE